MEVGYRRRPEMDENGKTVLSDAPLTREEIGAEWIDKDGERYARVTFHEPGSGGKPMGEDSYTSEFHEKVYMTLPLVTLGWPLEPFGG